MGDMGVFLFLFGVYLSQRGRAPDVFAHGQETLNRNLGALNTLLLLASSLLVVLAVRSLRAGARQRAPRLVLGAIAFGLGFVAVKVFEYHERIVAGQTPTTNSFYMYYFVLTGIHLGHLVVGLIVLGVLWSLTHRERPTPGQTIMIEGGACFWHMVDLLWIMIFPLLFLVRS